MLTYISTAAELQSERRKYEESNKIYWMETRGRFFGFCQLFKSYRLSFNFMYMHYATTSLYFT